MLDGPPSRWRARASADSSSRPPCSTTARSTARCASVSRCQTASNIVSCSASRRASVACRCSSADLPAAGGAHVVPGFVREALHVVGQVAGEIDDGRAEAGLGADAALREPRLDEVGEDRRPGSSRAASPGRPCRTAGAGRSSSPSGSARSRRTRSRPALLLRRGAQRVLDAAAVEAVDRLELVERDDDRPLPLGGQPAGQREDLVGQPVDVALGLDRGKRDGELGRARSPRLVADLRPRRRDRLGQPGRAPAPTASPPSPAPARSPSRNDR